MHFKSSRSAFAWDAVWRTYAVQLTRWASRGLSRRMESSEEFLNRHKLGHELSIRSGGGCRKRGPSRDTELSECLYHAAALPAVDKANRAFGLGRCSYLGIAGEKGVQQGGLRGRTRGVFLRCQADPKVAQRLRARSADEDDSALIW